MAISILGTISSKESETDPDTLSHTVTSGTDLLVVCISSQAGPATITSVTWNGSETMTKEVETVNASAGSDTGTAIFTLQNPTATTASISINHGDSTPLFTVCAINLDGVESTTPVEATNGNTGSSAAPSVSITTLTNGALVIDAVAVENGGTITKDATQTLAYEIENAFSGAGDLSGGTSYEEDAVAGSLPMDWTSANENWSMSAIAVKPASAGGAAIAPVLNLPLLGVA